MMDNALKYGDDLVQHASPQGCVSEGTACDILLRNIVPSCILTREFNLKSRASTRDDFDCTCTCTDSQVTRPGRLMKPS